MRNRKNKSIIIRFDADENIGIGHFNRCYALGESFKEQGFEIIYCCRYFDKSIRDLLIKSKSKYFFIPKKLSWEKEAEYILSKATVSSCAIILDISNSYILENISGIALYLKKLRKEYLVILIDGMKGNALLTKKNLKTDVAIVPYFGAEGLKMQEMGSNLFLTGPKYFVFKPEYSSLKAGRRSVRKLANKILITLGGADPRGTTAKVLKGISGINDRKVHARVVSGPCFSSALRNRIKRFQKDSCHKLDIVDSPKSLLKHMLWCDVAITSSGLTKYELAMAGTPSLQISFNNDCADVNKPFEKNKCAKHLGVHNDVSSDLIARETVKLLDDDKQRRLMSKAGQKLLDGQGAKRIVDSIRRRLK